MYFVWILLLLWSCVGCGTHPMDKDSRHESNFDYENKCLENVIRMEVNLEEMAVKLDATTRKLAKDIDNQSLDIGNIRKEMSQVVTDVRKIIKEDRKKTDKRLSKMERRVGNAAMEQVLGKQFEDNNVDHQLAKTLQESETSVVSLHQENESSLQSKKGVVFHVKNIFEQPSAYSVITFSTIVENNGGGYNLTSGCFRAPVSGVYWFSAQLCTLIDQFLSPSLYIRDALVSRVYVYDALSGDCGSVTAVATLQRGDEACLEAGPFLSDDAVWDEVNYNTNNFMGVLVQSD